MMQQIKSSLLFDLSGCPTEGCCALQPLKSDTEDTPRNLPFHPIRLADREWIAPLLAAQNSPASDGCFGTLLLWGSAFGLTVAKVDDRLLARHGGETLSFSFPAGSGPLRPALLRLSLLAAQEKQPLRLRGLQEDQKAELEQAFPGCFAFTELRDSADYLYDVEKMSTLSGKKLQSKRNHCNRFEQENPNWRFEPLSRRYFGDCMTLLNAWEDGHEDDVDEMQLAETQAIRTALAHYEELGLVGGILFADDDRPVAFTIGERTGGDAIDVRFEKADTQVHGAYQMINRQFVRYLQSIYPDLLWLNREEDMGHENLRRAKESYYPARLLMKYEARWVGASPV